MVRENNKRDQKGVEEEMPKFGAGSEFGRDQREEARRRRFGQIIRKYDPNAQPWLMRVGNKKEGKHYRGIREGGISENTSYYVFTHAQDGSFEAHPVKDWYNFTPRVAYRTLNAEEAEEKFAERGNSRCIICIIHIFSMQILCRAGKILNHFALMVNKKLHPDQTEGEDPDEDGKKGGGGSSGKKNLKISDMEEWLDEDDDDLDSDEGGSDGEKKTKKKKEAGRSKDTKKKKKKKDDADSEGIEDSDDGDGEGSEVDYMSDESSDSDDEVQVKIDQKGELERD
jgi:transcription initiation factor TFIIF subunit alpha